MNASFLIFQLLVKSVHVSDPSKWQTAWAYTGLGGQYFTTFGGAKENCDLGCHPSPFFAFVLPPSPPSDVFSLPTSVSFLGCHFILITTFAKSEHWQLEADVHPLGVSSEPPHPSLTVPLMHNPLHRAQSVGGGD